MSICLEKVAINIAGRPLVKNVSLLLGSGEVVGLLGPNGAGKTTTFNLVTGLLKPDMGIVYLDEINISNMAMPFRAKLGIAYLPQEPSIFRNLTVRENLELALSQNEENKASFLDRRERLIQDFRLSPFIDRLGFQLSGGERRRCEIARALAVGRTGPKYLLLDEPFAGIDPMAVADLQNLIQSLCKQGMGILITDHNVRETLSITDRAYLLYDGMLLKHGTVDELSNDEEVRRLYLGSKFSM